MATTIHVPNDLLERIDVRAKALGVSRNRLILLALESSLDLSRSWSPELIATLREPLPRDVADAFDASMAVVKRRRRSRRKPPQL